jgi:hypothetical protein
VCVCATISAPRMEYSLYFSLLAGISIGEEFARDCLHRQTVLVVERIRQAGANISQNCGNSASLGFEPDQRGSLSDLLAANNPVLFSVDMISSPASATCLGECQAIPCGLERETLRSQTALIDLLAACQRFTLVPSRRNVG